MSLPPVPVQSQDRDILALRKRLQLLTREVGPDHTHEAGDVTSGVFADDRISESSVTQHQGALTLTESQISDLAHYDTADFVADFNNRDTDELSEGATNLYFTNERVDDRVDALLVAGANITLSYNDAGDALTVAVAPQGSGGGLNADLLDGNHASAFAAAGHTHVEADISDLDHYDSADFDADFGGKTTDDLSEGAANLYWTATRFDNAFAAKDTDDLSEGITNLYFTNERVDDRVSALLVGGTDIGLTYDDAGNTLTIDFTGSSGGVTDHGALTGLGDDDHPQYAEIAAAESISGAWDFPATGFTVGTDVNLYRDAASILKTDDSFRIGGALSFSSTGSSADDPAIYWSGSQGLLLRGVTGTENDFAIYSPDGSQILEIPTGTDDVVLRGNSTLIFGSDTNLYRDSANVLKTDDDFTVGGGTVRFGTSLGTLVDGSAAGSFLIRTDGGVDSWFPFSGDGNVYISSNQNIGVGDFIFRAYPTGAGGGSNTILKIDSSAHSLILGGDVNLYRASANVLKTDDDLEVAGGTITVGLGELIGRRWSPNQGSGHASFEATSWSRTAYIGANLEYDGSGNPPDNSLYIDDSGAGSSESGVLLLAGANGPWLRLYFADPVDAGDAGTIAPLTSAMDISPAAGSLKLLSDINALHIQNEGDAFIKLEADTNNVGESNNAWIEFSQDGDLIRAVAGMVGSSGAPTGDAYSGVSTNAFLLGALDSAPVQVGTNSVVRLTIPSGSDEIRFGTAQDTNIYRHASHVLRTDDAFYVNGNLRSLASGGTDALTFAGSPSSQHTIRVDGFDLRFWMDGGAGEVLRFDRSSGHIQVRESLEVEDVSHFRPDSGTSVIQRWLRQDLAANTSAWDHRITTNGDLELRSISDAGSTNALIWQVDHDGNFAVNFAQGRIELGSDVNLYRASSGVLKTDDDFQVVGTLNLDSPGGRLVVPVGADQWAA